MTILPGKAKLPPDNFQGALRDADPVMPAQDFLLHLWQGAKHFVQDAGGVVFFRHVIEAGDLGGQPVRDTVLLPIIEWGEDRDRRDRGAAFWADRMAGPGKCEEDSLPDVIPGIRGE